MTRLTFLAPLSLWALGVLAGIAPLTRPGPLGQDPVVQDRGDQEPPPEEEQDELGQEEREDVQRDIFGRVRRRPAGERNPFEGAWQLIEIDSEEYPQEGSDMWGYLVIADGFLALQVHAIWYGEETGNDDLVDSYEAMICEYVVEGGSVLRCLILAGAFLDDEQELDFEVEGSELEFEIALEGGMLVLAWGEESLTFGRRLPVGRMKYFDDIFGKRSVRDAARGEDIFGRGRGEGVVDDEDDGDR